MQKNQNEFTFNIHWTEDIKCIIFNEANILSYKDFFSVVSHFHINGFEYFTSFPIDVGKHIT